MNEPVTSQDQGLQKADTFFAQATTEAVFWRPRFIADTPLMQHVPFLFWLVGAVRPRNIAVCGSGNGVASFALCQAMDKLNIAGRCLGIGFWPPEAAGKASRVPAALSDHAQLLYDDMLQWRCESSARGALAAIAPNCLDLLFIDAGDLPKGDLPLAEEWLAALRPDGVLVVHGYLPAEDGQADALQALAGGRPTICLGDGRGLVVLPHGDEPPARLRALLEVSEQGVLPAEIEMFFRRLGQGHLAVAQQIEASAQNRKLTSSLNATRQERDELREAYEVRSRKLSELQEDLYDRDSRLTGLAPQLELALRGADRLTQELQDERLNRVEETAALTLQIETLRQAKQEADAQLQASFREKERLSVEKAELTQQAADSRQAHEQALADAKAKAEAAAEAEAEAATLKQDLDEVKTGTQSRLEQECRTRFEETATLTRQIETLRQAKQEAEAQLQASLQASLREKERLSVEKAELTQQAANLRQEHMRTQADAKAKAEAAAKIAAQLQASLKQKERLKAENAKLTQRVTGLINSTSWRMTAPIRKVKSVISRS